MNTYVPRPREQAQELLEAYILENELQPGDRLPTEREMSRKWQMNLITLRKAKANLEASGRIVSVQGSGTRLRRLYRRNLQNLCGFTEDAVAFGFTPETRLLSFSVVECDKHLSKRFHRVLGEKIYRISRLRLLDGIPALIETSFIPAELAPGLETYDLSSESLYGILSEVYQLKLHHGLEKASLTMVTEEEAELLQVAKGTAALWMVSQTMDPSGMTVEYCRSVGRADMIEMTSRLKWKDVGERNDE
ncbi:MAG: GntR family transcriptional regulator [Oscillospiraceae bacterium]|nr:GntR family transcriptional regulator [Oscillospiraceae bacterium]